MLRNSNVGAHVDENSVILTGTVESEQRTILSCASLTYEISVSDRCAIALWAIKSRVEYAATEFQS